MKTLSKYLLTGWVLAFAVTSGYWGMATAPHNRWYMYFTAFDFWVLLAMTLSLGTVLGLGALLAGRRFPRIRPLLVASFWGWLALALANNFPDIHQRIALRTGWSWLSGPVWWLVVWGAGAAGIACALLFPAWRRGAARGWRILRCVLWPLVFIVPFSVGRLPSLEAAYGKGLDFARVPGNGKPAVVVLMFDMLGYGELFDAEGGVRPACTNFAALCARSDVYHAARSAGKRTATSIPGFILQERLEDPPRDLRYTHDDWPFTDGTNTVHLRDFAAQSLPALARERGGRTQTIGMHVPWDCLLPGLWDGTESMSIYLGHHGVHRFGTPPSFLATAKDHAAWYFLFVSKSPLSAALKVAGIDDLTEGQGWDERDSLVERAGRYFREALSPGDFFMVHIDLPHTPYLLGRGGVRLPPSLYHDDRAGLAAQMEGADWALGRWMEDLASSPAGRDAWIIVTSDHNLHNYRVRKGEKTDVPFLVHRPGQTVRRDIAGPADLTDLRHLIPDCPLFAEAAP